jgi:hypothetical protein
MIVRIHTGDDGQTHLKISLCRPRRATTLRFERVPTSCSAVSLRTIGVIGTPRPGGNTFLFSRGRWKSGSAMAQSAVLDRVTWSSLTTLTGQGHTMRSVGVPRISATVPVGA